MKAIIFILFFSLSLSIQTFFGPEDISRVEKLLSGLYNDGSFNGNLRDTYLALDSLNIVKSSKIPSKDAICKYAKSSMNIEF